MSFAFAAAAKAYQAAFDSGGNLDSGYRRVTPTPTGRPTIPSTDVDTDGLDPAAPGGPAPMNSGQGPYSTPVASDPLLQAPIQPGAPIPHVEGPDMDTTVLR